LNLAINRLHSLAAAAWLPFFGAALGATPAQIIFVRHAEKPAQGPELNARGWERAENLVLLFKVDERVREHGLPVAIFAASPQTPGGSIRSIQTMEPTSRALRIPLHRSIKRDDLAALVQAVRHDPGFSGKTVVVCWEHKKIPVMLALFGWKKGPTLWGDQVFDRLWILDFDHDRPVRFRDLPQKVLPGDSFDDPAPVAGP